MKKNILIGLLFLAISVNAQIGIGTQTPSANAMLDVTSSNKGILLPRLSDTGKINNPTEGLLIYNLSTKTPTFYNGKSWNSFSTASLQPVGDSLTYSISGPGNPLFNTGTYGGLYISLSGADDGPLSLSFEKKADINTIGFVNSMQRNLILGSIEFNMILPGTTKPYYSIKLTKWRISNLSKSSGSSISMLETYQIEFETIGYKDWLNNKSFSINQATKAVGVY
jgi:hypothetical protein